MVISDFSLNLILVNSVNVLIMDYFLEKAWLAIVKVCKLSAQTLFLALFYTIDKLNSLKIVHVFQTLFLCAFAFVDNFSNFMPHFGSHIACFTSGVIRTLIRTVRFVTETPVTLIV